MVRQEMHTEFWWGNFFENHHCKDWDRDGRTTIWILGR